MSNPFGIPWPLLTDSYKLTHYKLYPKAQKAVAYGEFRTSFNKDLNDHRMVFYGIRYIIDNYITKRWTERDVALTEAFLATHNTGFTEFPFPKELFMKFIREKDGYFPVKIEALPEGSVVYPHVPVFQVTAEGEYTSLLTYLETVLTMVWYPSTVATLSRKARTIIEAGFKDSVEDEDYGLLESRLHDFGFRGCTCLEQSVIGGTAHLLNFTGTDTLTAAYYAQYMLNEGRPVGNSIPATEHSVMTSFRTELEALQRTIGEYGGGVVSCVMDSYDYAGALRNLLPVVKEQKLGKGGVLVIRPDSGDPIEAILLGLAAGDRVFGSRVNKKGYKVLNGCSVIQGDGVNIDTLESMVHTVTGAGYSLQNVAFGMGGGLLQKVNRDTMSFATKISSIVYRDGTVRDMMKFPKSNKEKTSLPGEFVVRGGGDSGMPPIVYHARATDPESWKAAGSANQLRVVYDNGPVGDSEKGPWEGETFDRLRERVRSQWDAYPPLYNAVSTPLGQYQRQVHEAQLERLYAQSEPSSKMRD